MAGYMTYEAKVIAGTSLLDATVYSSVFNGLLKQITITTGGVGSTATTAWAPAAASTASSGLVSTGFFVFASEQTGAIFLRVAAPTAGGATYYPVTGGHSSSGAIVNAMSTAPFYGYPFPLVNDRLVISSTGTSGTAAVNGFVHTIKLVFEGSKIG